MKNYKWDEVLGKNSVAAPLFEAIGAFVLDVEPLTILRPDNHRSTTVCLHAFLPGTPVDTWTFLFYNWLVGQIV